MGWTIGRVATMRSAAIVRHFARQKSTVIFFDINDEAGTGLALELSGERLAANFLHVDLTDIAALRAGVAQARAAHGATEILVNDAAHDERHPTEEVTPDHWDDRAPTRKMADAGSRGRADATVASACTSQPYIVDGGWV